MEMVDGVPLRDVSGPVAISNTNATPVHVIKTQVGDPVSGETSLAVVALPGSVPKAASYAIASHENVEDGASKLSFTEARHAAEPEAKRSGSFEENFMRTASSSTPPPLQKSSRRWFPPLDAALLNRVVASEPATTLSSSLLAPQSPIGNSLATSTNSYSPITLLHESELNPESFRNIQGNLAITGNIISSAVPNPSSFIEGPLPSYHLGKRVSTLATVSSSPRMITVDTSNGHYSRLIQLPVSQSQANSVSTLSSQQEFNLPASFHVDSRASSSSLWVHPGTNSGPGFSFPMVPTTNSFGQVSVFI